MKELATARKKAGTVGDMGQGALGGRTCATDRLERRIPHQDTKKGDISKCGNQRDISLLSVPGKVFNRVLLNRMEDSVDVQLRDQQSRFLEQSVEWNSSPYTNFIDYEKAFDSVDRRTLWKLLRHHGVPEKIVNIVRSSWRTADRCISNKYRSQAELSTPPFLFFLVVDWIMNSTTSNAKHGIYWTARNQFEDLNHADDLALLSHTHEQIQIKTASLAAVSASVGLNIHKGKTKVLKYNTENTNQITLDEKAVEDVESFTYLRSIIDEQGGSDRDVKVKIGKARTAFLQLKNI
ncbi:unnamed protein product [Schistosoma mattheei]|uniref:Reverse transcriptase domain-containing protein n=1 Tax=Schistosoma mattheei TaxID=31246 RepID=A0A183NJB0_9TREM|nr:unnamed protein product [Schistosoma mattheei]